MTPSLTIANLFVKDTKQINKLSCWAGVARSFVRQGVIAGYTHDCVVYSSWIVSLISRRLGQKNLQRRPVLRRVRVGTGRLEISVS